jgi:hypothetical protein
MTAQFLVLEMDMEAGLVSKIPPLDRKTDFWTSTESGIETTCGVTSLCLLHFVSGLLERAHGAPLVFLYPVLHCLLPIGPFRNDLPRNISH